MIRYNISSSKSTHRLYADESLRKGFILSPDPRLPAKTIATSTSPACLPSGAERTRHDGAYGPICLSVCMRCKPADWTGDDSRRPGAILAEDVERRCITDAVDDIVLREIRCMSQCNRPCVVALSCDGKFTYLFGDLAPQRDVAAILETVALYRIRRDGFMARYERPDVLRAGILGRIPPLGSTSDLVHRQLIQPGRVYLKSG